MMSNKKFKELKSMFADLKREESKQRGYANDWLMRYHRCYLDGSYTGEKAYLRHKKEIKKITQKRTVGEIKKSLEIFALRTFKEFLRKEGFHGVTNWELNNILTWEDLDRDLFIQTIKDNCTDLISE